MRRGMLLHSKKWAENAPMGDAGTVWLDTNIIIRYLTGTPEHLAHRATEIIDGDRDLVVSELVLSEAAYVFSSVYRAAEDRGGGCAQRVSGARQYPSALSHET